MKNKKSKKVLITIFIIISAIFLFKYISYKFPLFYAASEYSIWIDHNPEKANQAFNEMVYAGSLKDRLSVKSVMKKAEQAFSDVDIDDEEAKEKYGFLSRYCINVGYGGDSTSEKHNIKLVSVKLDGNKGYMWISYSQRGYNEQNVGVCGSSGINARWTIKKNANGEWEVVEIFEHP